MKLVSVSLAVASVVLVPCYGQQEKAKATAPAVKSQAKPTVSAEKRFAHEALVAASNDYGDSLRATTKLLEGREYRILRRSSRCWSDLKIETRLQPLLIANSPERKQACEDLDAKSEVEEDELLAEADKVTAEKKAIMDLWTTRWEYADTCAKVYRTTGNKKVSDVTVIETEQIKECRSLDLYPPQ